MPLFSDLYLQIIYWSSVFETITKQKKKYELVLKQKYNRSQPFSL